MENHYLQDIFHLVDTGFLKSELFVSGHPKVIGIKSNESEAGLKGDIFKK
jgi:hypothetical protein